MSKAEEKDRKGKGDQAAPEIKFVMMRRESDGDGPHPIHPGEVENYRQGGWVEVESE